MIEQLEAIINEHRKSFFLLFRDFHATNKPFHLKSDIVEIYREFSQTDAGGSFAGTVVETIMMEAQECSVSDPWIVFAVRWSV
ncbi:hypothetical protein KDL45_11075, partial [bacterium]|nr:hypothetical protein [bacterium]